MPWKNGAGSTVELYREPAAGDFDFRISIATIGGDGPFSVFPGFDRIIMSLSGPSILLEHQNPHRTAVLRAFEPYHFDGGLSTFATLQGAGPARDFNIMTRRGYADLSCQVKKSHTKIAAEDRTVFVYPLEKTLRVEGCSSVVTSVNPGDLLKVSALESGIAIASDAGRFVLIEMRR